MTKNNPTSGAGKSVSGVIGSGSFGTTVAKLLAYNGDVLIYSRNTEKRDQINQEHISYGVHLDPKIRATSDIVELAETCKVIFPVVPSKSFRSMMRDFSYHLKPYHILIHGTKGFDLASEKLSASKIDRKDVSTMSEIIEQESSVVRIGALAGPNLAKEILEGQPTASVVASPFDEVIKAGQKLLSSEQFFVFGSHDLKGAEIAGALKNIIAVGSGILGGLGLGKNIQAMIITRGLSEMIYFGRAMGASTQAFLGTSGIGDLIATATSEDSRNYTFGKRLGQGEHYADILGDMEEVAEGVKTLKIAYLIIKSYRIAAPITTMLYRIVFENFDIHQAIKYLMSYPYRIDVDFLQDDVSII